VVIQRQNDITFDSSSQPFDHQINVDDTKLAQPFYGFGAAMTDSSAYLFNRYTSPSLVLLSFDLVCMNRMKQKNPARLRQVLADLFNSSNIIH
jgi:hypothetical protein